MINKSKEARETMSLFLVETIQTFKHQYLVRAQSAEHAQDTVVCQEAPEVSQKHLDETIISCRAVTQDEALNVHKGEDQRTLTNYWLPLETVIHTVKY